jgi:hypothetical protein
MQRPLTRLVVLAAVMATAGLASCRGDAPTESSLEHSLFSSRDSSSGDTIPGDSVPNDTTPPDTIPPDTIPPDTIPPDTIPPDTIPPDTIPPDTTTPPDSVRAFDLIVTVVGAGSSGDTTQTVPLHGARVTLFRYGSLPDSTSAPNAVIAGRPTGPNGTVTFHRLLPAWYRVAVDPPRGSPYVTGSALVAPATTPQIAVQVLLLRAP